MRVVRVGIALMLGLLTISGIMTVVAVAPVSSASPAMVMHAPIVINGDLGFTPENGVTAGDGSLSNPYVISGWEVDASTSSPAGISISNTNAYFIVRDTYVHSGSSGGSCGFEVSDCTHGRIENCIANSCTEGIFASTCHNMTITGCYAANNVDAGIFVELCYTNITVANNEVCHNRHGIYNNDAWNTTISNNRVHNNSQYGIIMTVGSVSVRVVSNQVADNGAGVTVDLWSYWILTNDIFIYHNQILRNTVQASDNNLGHTHWDDGYPSGGNFWSDYRGVDLYSGPEQNTLGPDGIGDTPYSIDPTSSDRYPLMQPTNNPLPPPPPPPISARVDFDMNSFNTGSSGKWVTAYIGLPKGYNVADVVVGSVRLNGNVSASGPSQIGDFNHDKALELMVKFDRLAAAGTLTNAAKQVVTVTGSLTNGTVFSGSDMIKVKSATTSNLFGSPITGGSVAVITAAVIGSGVAACPVVVVRGRKEKKALSS